MALVVSTFELTEYQADETQESLHVPREYHSALIGPSGKYVNRMEETHGVKIFFPRDKDGEGDNKGREALKPNEVLLKGGRKGVAAARAEILEVRIQSSCVDPTDNFALSSSDCRI